MKTEISRSYPTADESQKQINAAFEARLPEIEPAIRNVAGHDDDMAQVGLVAAYHAFQSDQNATKRYLVNAATWNIICELRRNKFVDNKHCDRRELNIVHYQSLPFEDGVMANVALNDDRLHVEDQAVFNVDFELFIGQLSPNEYNYVKCKVIDGLSDDAARKELGLKSLTVTVMKKNLHKKIDRYIGA